MSIKSIRKKTIQTLSLALAMCAIANANISYSLTENSTTSEALAMCAVIANTNIGYSLTENSTTSEALASLKESQTNSDIDNNYPLGLQLPKQITGSDQESGIEWKKTTIGKISTYDINIPYSTVEKSVGYGSFLHLPIPDIEAIVSKGFAPILKINTDSPSNSENSIQNIMVEIPLEESGYRTVLYEVKDGGNLELIKNSYETKEGLVANLKFGVSYLVVYTNGTNFSDVPDAIWYKDYVDYVSNRGLMVGTSTDTFSPFGLVTRSAIVTTIWRYFDCEQLDLTSMDNPFIDVDTNSWYFEPTMWAYKNDLIEYKNGLFEPNNYITLEDLAVILYNISGKPEVTTYPLATEDCGYSEYSENAVKWAAQNSMIPLQLSEDILDEEINRAQLAMTLTRYCEYLTKQGK